jgi:uncharacterized protein YcaQ
VELSAGQARRLALAAQGFGRRPARATSDHIRRLAARVHAFQIDSVNVLVRAHYVPAFARLGPYPMEALDALAYRRRELFEYWGHAACLLPTSLYPLVRYRMRAEATREYMASERGAYMARVYAEVAERGPLAAGDLSDPGAHSGGWWGWIGASGSGKATLEHLYDSGLVAIAGRRGFERLYDIAERVIPRAALDAPAPPPEEAMKRLICLGAKACGAGTFADVTGYLNVDGWRDRTPPGPLWERPKGAAGRPVRPVARRLVGELVEEGRLLAARVEGWREPAYVRPGARVPRSVDARALVSPFDSLVWAIAGPAAGGIDDAGAPGGRRGPAPRSRVQRLFGMRYTLELYVPAARRVYGYYVYPFLLGDTLVARCDLKADRQRRVLVVQGAFLEPGQDGARVAAALASELRDMGAWLELDRVEVAERGDLARRLARSLS